MNDVTDEMVEAGCRALFALRFGVSLNPDFINTDGIPSWHALCGEECRVALAAALARKTVGEWQPIETARAFAEHSICWPHGKGTTLFWDQTGPLMRYADGTLYLEDLNPEVKIKWRMSHYEMFKAGLRFVWASIRP